jgi:hypothetical protein
VPVYTKPAILGLPPTAVLTKQEMPFRPNLPNPINDLFWTARALIRPPVLADALAQGHAILKYEGHLTQKQGGRRLSAQYGRSGATSAAAAGMPLSFGAGVVTPTSVTAAVQGSWRSPAPVLPTNPGFVTKEDMDIRANQLNPNNVRSCRAQCPCVVSCGDREAKAAIPVLWNVISSPISICRTCSGRRAV